MIDMKTFRFKIAGFMQGDRDAGAPEAKALLAPADYLDTGWRVLGLPFGGPFMGRDLDGETFHPGTEIWLTPGDWVNLTYYHGFGPDSQTDIQNPPVIIGRAKYAGVDERGHWFEVYLDEREELARRLLSVDIRTIRASSGAVSHLVRASPGGLLDIWPVGELALFDVNEWRLPANDLAVVERAIRSMEDDQEANTAFAMASIAPALPDTVSVKSKFTGGTMDENETPVVQGVDLSAQIAALTAEVDALKAVLPGVERGKPTMEIPGVVKSLGEPDMASYKSAWLDFVRSGDPGTIRRFKRAKAAMQEGTTTEGGYAVPDGVYNGIVAKRDELSLISRLGVRRVNWRGDKYLYPTEDSSMTKFTIVAEEGAITAAENEPTLGQCAITIYTLKKLVKVSVELLEDENSDLEGFLWDAVGRAVADTENYYALIGSGSSAPQGVFVGGTAGLTLDSATAIGAGEISELMGKLGTPYHNSAAFVMKPATWFYLKGLTSTSSFVFTDGLARLSGTVDGPTLEGFPVVLNSNAAGVQASAKSLLFGNFDYLGWVENRALTLQRLNELYAGNGQVGLLFFMRFGCAVLQAEAFQYATHPTA